jgi:uncharacterized protein YggE
VVATIVGLCLPTVLHAQDRTSTVSGNGMASIEKTPELIRLKIDITASAANIKDALAKLGKKRENAVAKLKEMGAAEKSIKVDGPRIVPDPMEVARRQMGMMRSTADAQEEEEETPPKVCVGVTLQAEWELKADGAEAMLIFAHELKEKIKKADLAGLKDEQPTPEEEEKMAEIRNRLGRYNSDRLQPGEPIIIYVAKVSDAERNTLLADAFAKAKAEATQLATVAGLQVGRLYTINGREIGSEEDYPAQYDEGGYQIIRQARAMIAPENRKNEAMGLDPSTLTYRLSVMAVYDLK